MKDHIRDYATEAFRFYARLGFPSYEDIRREIYDDALKLAKSELDHGKGIRKPTEAAVIRVQAAVDTHADMLNDILAVETTLRALPDECRRAVELVYFAGAGKPLNRGDIAGRVATAASAIPADRRTVFRWLKTARRMFALERRLRTDDRLPQWEHKPHIADHDERHGLGQDLS